MLASHIPPALSGGGRHEGEPSPEVGCGCRCRLARGVLEWWDGNAAPGDHSSVAGGAGLTGAATSRWASSPSAIEGTGYWSHLTSPGTDTCANSWAPGTNPAVHSVYLRLVAGMASTRPATERRPTQLTAMATEALVLPPALTLVQIIGNDLRCDGTDHAHCADFETSVREAVETIVDASPRARVVLIGEPLQPASYATAVAARPRRSSFHRERTLLSFSADRTINRVEVVHTTGLLEGYEMQLTQACRGTQPMPHRRRDGGQDTVQLDELGPDRRHPSVVGNARLASAEWPVIAEVLAAA